MCDISEHNPESGIDGPTSNKLLSRKRASGASPYVQWREIWNILFPDDEDSAIQPFGKFMSQVNLLYRNETNLAKTSPRSLSTSRSLRTSSGPSSSSRAPLET